MLYILLVAPPWMIGELTAVPCRVTGWRASGKPVFEVNSLAREVKGNTVPLPKALLKLILTMVVPRVLQRKVQAMLPVELGQYLSEANQGVHITGES